MLKKINPIISPELLKTLDEMGHTEEIVICDGNMPVNLLNRNIIRLDGHNVPEILQAILEIFPLDDKTETPVAIVDWDGPKQPIWDEYERIILNSEEGDKMRNGFEMLSNDAFFERCRRAAALIATTEKTLAGNILLRKGLMQG